MTPLLAIWALGAMWFTTGDNEQKAKNLDANQHCALTTGTDTLTGTDYVIEGIASLVTDQATRETVATAFEEAYGWQLAREDGTWYQTGRRHSDRHMCSSTESSRTRLSPSQPDASHPRLVIDGADRRRRSTH